MEFTNLKIPVPCPHCGNLHFINIRMMKHRARDYYSLQLHDVLHLGYVCKSCHQKNEVIESYE